MRTESEYTSWARIRNLELFIAPRTMSSPLGVIHVNHILEHFIATKTLTSRPKVAYVIDNLELFIASKTLSS